MFNFQNTMNFINMVKNPQQFLQSIGIPQECMQSPDSVAQYLLDNGKVNQQQIQQASQMYQQMFKR